MHFFTQLCCSLAILWTLADCLEVGIPERFLRPRNFNPHPYLDVRTDEEQAQQLLQDVADLPHPYRLFERPPTRGDVSNNGPVQFPKVPETAQIQQTPGTTVTGAGASKSSAGRLKPSSVKHPLNSLVNSVNTIRPLQDFQVLEYISSPADASHLPPLYSSRLVRPSSSKSSIKPKNYAFSYAVKDGHSGDDFSHSQAQAGAKTMGEYRVKLPDGRTQVVSYTADHRGYRADVRYDEENLVEPVYSDYNPSYKPSRVYIAMPAYRAGKASLYSTGTRAASALLRPVTDYTPIHEEQSEDHNTQQSVTSRPSYATSIAAPTPSIYRSPESAAPQAAYFIHSTPSPIQFYSTQTISSAKSSPYYQDSEQEYFLSSTPAPHLSNDYYPSSTVPPQYHAPSTPSSGHRYYLVH